MMDFDEIYDYVDESFKQLFEVLDVEPTCRRGCSFCCHNAVYISDADAAILADEPIDMARLEIQQGRDIESWRELSYEEKACVFLKDDECSVYDKRPLICRNYYVTSDPKMCDNSVTRTVTAIQNPISQDICNKNYDKYGVGLMADMLLKNKKT